MYIEKVKDTLKVAQAFRTQPCEFVDCHSANQNIWFLWVRKETSQEYWKSEPSVEWNLDAKKNAEYIGKNVEAWIGEETGYMKYGLTSKR